MEMDTKNWSRFSIAVLKKDYGAIKKLIKSGEDVNKENADGSTPLFLAVQMNNHEAVKHLLAARKIDVNKAVILQGRGGYATTPLHEAALYGRTECLKLLLAARGIDVNRVNGLNDTPLFYAVLGNSTECVKLLLAVPGIDVNKANTHGETPLERATNESTVEIQELLRKAGAK